MPALQEPTLDEYDVYSSILRKKYWTPGQELVIGARAVRLNRMLYDRMVPLRQYIQWWREKFPGLAEETARDLLSFRKSTGRLAAKFHLPEPYTILSDDELKSIRTRYQSEQHDPWKTFHEQFPKARSLTNLSRVGLDTRKTQALVAVHDTIYSLASTYNLWFFKKEDTNWHVVGSILLGMS
jgi:hypothetical protein